MVASRLGSDLRSAIDELERLRGIVPAVLEQLNDEMCAENTALARKLGIMAGWLEANQPDVFKRGLWDALSGA
jgi:hypothetical protein